MSKFFFKDKNLVPENIRKGVKIGRVTGTLEGGGGGGEDPVNRDITADSSTIEQVFTPGSGYDGIGIFTLLPYLLQSKTVDSSTAGQVVVPDNGYDGLYQVIVSPYTLDSKTVDSSTVSQVVNSSADGLSSVTVNPYTLDSKTVDSSTVSQTVTSDADGLNSVTVNPYTLDSKTVDSSIVSQTVTSDEDGLSSVTVNPYTLDSKTVDSSTVSQVVNSSADGMSSVTVNPYTLDSKTVDSSTVSQTVTSDVDGLSSVTVNPYTLDSKSLDPSTVSQTVNSSADGLSSVSVSAVTSSIDSNIQAGNIKNGVTILGVTGNLASGDWVANAKKSIVDISSKTLTGGTHAYAYYSLFRSWKTTSGARTLPQIAGTQCLDHEFCNTFANPGRVALNNYTIPFTEIGGYGMDHFLSYVNIDVNSYNNTVLFPNLTTIGDFGLCEAFYGNGGIRWASMPNLQTVGSQGLDKTFKGNNFGYGRSVQPDFISSVKKIKSYGMQYCFEGCSYLNYGISFDNLDEGYDSNSPTGALYGCFKGTGITSIAFPKLEWTNGAYYFQSMCENCTSLTSVSFPEFYMENARSVFASAFKGCTSLTSVSFPKYREVRYNTTFENAFPNRAISFNVHPGAVTRSDWGNIVCQLSAVTTITLSEDATVDIDLHWQPSLSFSTVYGILSHLDLNTSGKTCTFYSNGLVISDDLQGSLQAAYDAAVNAGWTINNLTINPSYMKINSPSDGILDLGTSNTIGFDTVSSWTAVTSSNDIVLDSYFGSAGLAQSVTVTAPSNWEGSETITFTCNNTDTVVRVYNYDNLTLLTKITTNNDVIDIANLTTNATVFSADMQRMTGGGYVVSNNGGTTAFYLYITSGSYYPEAKVESVSRNMWAYNDRRYQDFRGGLSIPYGDKGFVFIGIEASVSANTDNRLNVAATDTPMCAGDSRASFDFYGLKHYENWLNYSNRLDPTAVLVHDYKPASKNNVCGFFDNIEKIWYPCRNGLVTGTV